MAKTKKKIQEDPDITQVLDLEEEEGSTQKQDVDSANDRAILARSLDESNRFLLIRMCEEADRLIGAIQQRLRLGQSAMEELREAEALIYNLNDHVERHRYTMVDAFHAYTERQVRLYHLAQINDLVLKGIFPSGADGRGHVLNPMQQQVLWT